MPLALTIKEDHTLRLVGPDGEITVHFVEVTRRRCRIAVDAPREVQITRDHPPTEQQKNARGNISRAV